MIARRLGTVLVDAGNLRAGGAVQVAASFLDELVHLKSAGAERARHSWLHQGLTVSASPAVLENMTADPRSLGVEVVDRDPKNARIWMPTRRRHDVSFVVFGPEYGWPRARHRIVGFADGVSLYPGALDALPRGKQLLWSLRARLSRHLFSKADQLVVEAPHVKSALKTRWGVPGSAIAVVPNVLNGVFSDPDCWVDPVVPHNDPGTHLVCYVTRAYAHKNLDRLGTVGSILQTRYRLTVRFVVTLTEAEWAARTTEFRASAINLGPVTVNQLPLLYRSCAASVFPSLIESFSVSPLEAMAAGCPLAASDRDFVRDVAGEAAVYFEPTDPLDIAERLAALLTDPQLRATQREIGLRRAASWPTSRDRAQTYVDLITRALGEVDRTGDGV